MKKILILGGGFAGIEVFRRLHKLLHPAHEKDVSIELISRTNYFTFYPMLHEAATGGVSREHVVQPLRETLVCCGKDFHQATVTKIDPAAKTVETDKGPHSYDILVVALGVEQGFFGTPGAAEHALALKQLPGAIAIRNRLINSFEQASEMHDKMDQAAVDKFLHFVIVGGGATGTELAGQISDLIGDEMRRFYGDVPQSMAKITLIHAGGRVLEQLSEKASEAAAKRLNNLGVELLLNERVVEVTPTGVKLASGKDIASNSVFWTGGTESVLEDMLPPELLTDRKLLKVDPTFQVSAHPEIFGLGDCATVSDPEYSYPPLAQAATQAAKVVAKNVVAHLHSQPLQQKKFRNRGSIIPIGDWYAVYDKKPLIMRGRTVWLARRGVFLKTMYGWGNRLQVAFDWVVDIFLPRDTSEL